MAFRRGGRRSMRGRRGRGGRRGRKSFGRRRQSVRPLRIGFRY